MFAVVSNAIERYYAMHVATQKATNAKQLFLKLLLVGTGPTSAKLIMV